MGSLIVGLLLWLVHDDAMGLSKEAEHHPLQTDDGAFEVLLKLVSVGFHLLGHVEGQLHLVVGGNGPLELLGRQGAVV